MNLTKDEIKIVVNLLLQLSIPLSEAPVVLAIVEKLRSQIEKDK